jgi:hypothetical protein
MSLLLYITICNVISTEISCGCLKDTNRVQTEHRNINKGYSCDQWQAFWTWPWTAFLVTCTSLEPLTHQNLHCTPCSTSTRSTDVMCVRFELLVLWGLFLLNVVTTPPVSLWRLYATWSYTNSTVSGRSSGTEQLHCSNSVETLCVGISVSQTDRIVMAGRVEPSVMSQTNPVDTPLQECLKVSPNTILLIYHYILRSDIQTKILWIILISTKCLTCIAVVSILLLTLHPPVNSPFSC